MTTPGPAPAFKPGAKRLQDLADAQALLEQEPSLSEELTEDEKNLLDRLPR